MEKQHATKVNRAWEPAIYRLSSTPKRHFRKQVWWLATFFRLFTSSAPPLTSVGGPCSFVLHEPRVILQLIIPKARPLRYTFGATCRQLLRTLLVFGIVEAFFRYSEWLDEPWDCMCRMPSALHGMSRGLTPQPCHDTAD